MIPFHVVCPPFPYRFTQTRGEYFRRIFRVGQMDLDYTFAQIIYLCVSPRKVYHFVQYRKQTKNQWSRDDPALIVILVFFIAIAGFAYGIAFGRKGWSLFLASFLPCLYFLLSGVVIASIAYFVAARYLKIHSFSTAEQTVEWAYCFDIHCNATFPLFLLCFVVHYFILPAVLSPGLAQAVVSNFLFGVGLCYYCYVTSIGYTTLPFLSNTEFFLFPAVIIVGLLILLAFLRISMTVLCLSMFII